MRDFDIRLAMKHTTLSKFYQDDSIVVEELNLPSTGSRIDIAVVNGSFHGYEIKSSCDTLVRLEKQIESYSKVFDYLSIVTEEKYLQRITLMSPDWVEIICVTSLNESIEMVSARKGHFNDHKEGFHLARILRKDEIQSILTENSIKFKKSSRAWTLCETLAETLNITELAHSVRLKLKERSDWKLYSRAGLRSSQNDDCGQFSPRFQHCLV